MECLTCIETYEEDDFITCQKCQFATCYNCFKHGITQDIKDPMCLNCKNIFDTEFILENCQTDWLYKSFLPHMGKVLLEKEKSLLPYTQNEVSKELKLKQLRNEIKSLPSNEKLKKKYKDINKFTIAKQIKDDKKKELMIEKNIILNKPKESVAKNQQFIGRCSFNKCKGYINKEFKCELCLNDVCESCFVSIVEHGKKCKTEDLQLREILAKDSKSCPKCYIPILKAGGCDQMWCTNCNTAFSWTTGKIETGTVHNPHFYEWLANNSNSTNINIENIACGELPRIYELQTLKSIKNNYLTSLFNIHRMIIHVQTVEIMEYEEDRVKDNIDLRVKYLLNTITEEQWMKTLITRERKRMTNRAYKRILEMFVMVGTDLFRRLVVEKNVTKISDEFSNFLKYIRNCFDRVYTLYGGSIPEHVFTFKQLKIY